MEILTLMNKIAELGVLVVLAGVSVWNQVQMYNRLNSDVPNKQIWEKLTQLEKGYISHEVLKDKMVFFIQSVRWKLQNTQFDIIHINNIAENPERLDKKLDNMYNKETNKMNNILEDMCDKSTNYIIMKTFVDYLDENKKVIEDIFTPLKTSHTKEIEEECKKNINIEMEMFQENILSKIKEIL